MSFYMPFKSFNARCSSTGCCQAQKKKAKGKKKPKKSEIAVPKNPSIVHKLVDRATRYGSQQKQLPGDRLLVFFSPNFLKFQRD